MSFLQALLLSILQGVTELFPVSSLGHTVIVPALLGWHAIEKSDNFLPLVVTMHFGTAVALLIYFRHDWLEFGLSVLGRKSERGALDRRLFIMLVFATLPAAVLGFLLEKKLKHAFATPMLAAVFLIANGVLLLMGERLRKSDGSVTLDTMGWESAVGIGFAQALALIPGFSRSGTTVLGGIFVGLNHEESARFAFLMATPIIFGAAAHEIPKIDHHALGLLALMSFVVSGLFAYASTTFLMRWFKSHDQGALAPFAYYCAIAGFVSIAWLNFM